MQEEGRLITKSQDVKFEKVAIKSVEDVKEFIHYLIAAYKNEIFRRMIFSN